METFCDTLKVDMCCKVFSEYLQYEFHSNITVMKRFGDDNHEEEHQIF